MRDQEFPVLLPREPWFPDPRMAATGGDFDGLLAIGGDLSVERLKLAYQSGVFPWTVNPITWWSPDPRGIIPIDNDAWPRSLRKFARRKPFEITFDRAFAEVMARCAEQPRPGAWIGPEFIAAYTAFHEAGHAHSIECWRDGQLVGGLYGVAIGGMFAGESMFHTESNASKIALYELVNQLREAGFTLFDTQMVTDTTARLGAVEIERTEYLRLLAKATSRQAAFPVDRMRGLKAE